ncbi:hypothetical protein BIY29_05435 [Brenneria alni]|uniref:Uncharacterized protein n=1 Tax=Brenneria alni TaxID=71656 RepID=A0A421DR68_9GAMM|nr:DUF6682 family protein [Brenneria alni]RLM26502.1 hypothetical protein BIY29_05435 [Brenneria alni]
MTTINDIIGRANTLLMDSLWLRWPKSELLDYFNDAINAVIIMRPDAGSSIEIFDCAPGTRQQIPDGAIRLLEITRVIGGRAIQPFPRDALDYQYPDWHSMTGPIERYCYDEQTPQTFFVFPGALAGVQLEVNVARLPAPASISDLGPINVREFPIDDLYVNPVLEWIIFRAFSKDSENGNNAAFASQHYQTFVDLLGVKTQTDTAAGQKKQAQYNGSTQA